MWFSQILMNGTSKNCNFFKQSDFEILPMKKKQGSPQKVKKNKFLVQI